MNDLPHGTVTFLLCAVGESLEVWLDRPRSMTEAISAFEREAGKVVQAHGGRVFKTVGSELLCAFAMPWDALRAAHALQRLPHGSELAGKPPRITVHTGAATERDGDYFGPPLNLAARMLELAAPGQVLVSRTTAVLAAESTVPELALRYLGARPIRGIERRERLYGLEGPGLEAGELSPDRSASEVRGLPTPRTQLLGREHELRELEDTVLRPDVRLVTLTGPGGSGKTRLAIQLALELADRFDDGIVFVDLTPVREPDYVPSAIAGALGIRESGGRPTLDLVCDALRDLRAMLILDNFEHLLDAAPLLTQILRASSLLTLVVTSRATLQIAGERDYPVPPLDPPKAGAKVDLPSLLANPAVALFAQLASASKPDFRLTEASAATVAEICRRLDGLPLAIELAAARTTVLSPQQILARLDRRLSLLTRGPRDLPTRQQTLRDTIAWSYDLLAPPEQTAFRRLAAFNGGCTLEAAEAVLAESEEEQSSVIDLLASLMDKSLLRSPGLDVDEPRFTMLETVRELAGELLQANEEHTARLRHAQYWLQFVEVAELGLRGSEQMTWFGRLDRDYGNVQAALEWSLGAGGEPGVAARLCGALGWYWFQRGLATEGYRWLERVKTVVDPSEVSPELGRIAYARGSSAYLLGDVEETLRAFGECARIGEALENPELAGSGLAWVALFTHFRGEPERALQLISRAQAQLFKSGDPWLAAGGMFLLGVILDAQGKNEASWTAYREAIQGYRSQGDRWGVASPTVRLGHLAYRSGRVAEAAALFREGLETLREIGDPVFISRALDGLGLVAYARGEYEQSARYFGASSQLRQATGITILYLDRPIIEACWDDLASKLGPAGLEAARAVGASLPIDEVIDQALASPAS